MGKLRRIEPQPKQLKLKLNRPVKPKLNRYTKPWYKKEEYQNYPIVFLNWEDSGVNHETNYIYCKKHGRQIGLEVCMKGIYYFNPKSKDCKLCWRLESGVPYPPEFLNAQKKNVVPEALMVLTAPQQKKTLNKLEEEQ